MKLHFIWTGKTRDRNCAELVKGYLERIKRFAPYEVSELKEQTGAAGDKRVVEAESVKLLSAINRDDFVVLLDENGREFSSLELAEFIGQQQRAGIKRLAFVIGGFAGVSNEVRLRAKLHLSLTRMTLTHELARVVLTEQIYRAFTLLAGLPYHRF
jgi:23S rRNA (pseudouridine1915-N3)-methyltransferase